jgi:hypothetical protein
MLKKTAVALICAALGAGASVAVSACGEDRGEVEVEGGATTGGGTTGGGTTGTTTSEDHGTTETTEGENTGTEAETETGTTGTTE